MLGNDYKEIHLRKDAVVAITRQRSEIADLTNRLTDVTNEFRVPLGSENRDNVENLQSLKSTSNLPYRRLYGRYEVDGIDVLNDARAVVQQTSPQEMRITLLGGEKNLFERIEGANLEDLDWDAELTTWSRTTAAGKQNVTEGVIYAAVEYGGTLSTSLIEVNTDFLPPSYYYHSLVRKIVEEAGFTLDTSDPIWTDPRFSTRIIAFSNTDLELNDPGLVAEERTNLEFDWNAGAITWPVGGGTPGAQTSPFDTVNTVKYDPSGNMPTNFRYDATVATTYEVVYDFQAFLNPHTGANITMHLKKNGVNVASTVHAIASGQQYPQVTGGVSAYGVAGDYFELEVAVDTVTWVVRNIKAGFSLKETMEYGDTVSPAAIFPKEVKQDEFLRDFMRFYGLIIDVGASSKIVRFIRHIDIKNTVEDLSEKVEQFDYDPNATTRTKPRGYGKSTLFRYDNLEWFSDQFAQGVLSVNHDDLPDEVEYYRSLFTASEQFGLRLATTYGGGGLVPLFNNTDGDELGLRTFFVEIENAANFWTFKDSTSSSTESYLAKAYFFNASYDLRLQAILDFYYADIAEVLAQYREVVLRVNFSPSDVAAVDFYSIKNVGGTYFYLEKIKDWVRGELATVTGVRY